MLSYNFASSGDPSKKCRRDLIEAVQMELSIPNLFLLWGILHV